MTRHKRSLAGVVGRVTGIERLRDRAIDSMLPPDTSIERKNSTFHTEGSTTHVTWPREDLPHFDDHLWTLLLVESALLQYWQLRLLNLRLAATLRKQGEVRRVQGEVIYGLEEHRSRLMSGTANDSVRRLLESWHADRLYRRILESLDQLQQRLANDQALRAARRANLLATAAAVVAVVLGLPAVSQSLDIAQQIPRDGILGWLATPLRSLADDGAKGAWIGYLAVLGVVAVVFVMTILTGRLQGFRPPVRQRAPAGEAWPLGTVEVRPREAADEEGEDEQLRAGGLTPESAIGPPARPSHERQAPE
jgi:hypothetical protein